jgi:hypothetical protein
MKDVLEAIAGRKAGTSVIMTQLKEMPDNAFLKAAALNISALRGHGHVSMILDRTGMAFFLAMEKDENLKLKLKLKTDTAETADNIEQVVKGYIALARMKHTDRKLGHKILDFIKTKRNGNLLQLELSYPSDDLMVLLGLKEHEQTPE